MEGGEACGNESKEIERGEEGKGGVYANREGISIRNRWDGYFEELFNIEDVSEANIAVVEFM